MTGRQIGHTAPVIKMDLFIGLVTLALWIFSLVDVIGTDEGRMRHLPKLWWLLIVLFFPLAGSIAWLVAGRPQTAPGTSRGAGKAYREYDRPGRFVAPDAPLDEEFLRKVRERAEQQRQAHREQQQRETDPPSGS